LDGANVAAVCPAYTVVLTADRKTVKIVTRNSGKPVNLLAGLELAITHVSLSPSGTSAALLHGRSIDVVSGFPSEPKLKRTIKAPPDTIRVAVSDDGEALAFYGANTIHVIKGGNTTLVAAAELVPDLRFHPGSHDLVYIDGNSVLTASAEGVRIIAGIADGLVKPQAAVFSQDGRVVIADTATNDLLITGQWGGISERVKLPCEPDELGWMNGSTLALRCTATDQIYLIQLIPGGARVLFVPEPGE
jgi:hypothetical protein